MNRLFALALAASSALVPARGASESAPPSAGFCPAPGGQICPVPGTAVCPVPGTEVCPVPGTEVCPVPGTEVPGFFRVASTGGAEETILAPDGSPRFIAGVCHVHPRGTYSHALRYSPYKRFVEANYPSLEAWADETAARLRAWGFNSLGAASDVKLLAGRGFSHVSDSALRMGMSFATTNAEHSIRPSEGRPCSALPNVFHPDFPAHCDRIAAERCAAAKDDPDLLGWYIDNELAWWAKNGQRATGVYDAILEMPPEHSARRELERFLAEWSATNMTQGSSGAPSAPANMTQGPSGLAGSPRRGAKGGAALAFLRHFARTYFEITTAAIRRHDPNHMILGCRFAGLQGAHPVVWEECGRFCDIVSFNCYPWADLDHGVVLDEKCGVPMAERFAEYHGYAKRPMIVSEWSFPALDTGRPCFKGAGQRVPTQKERAEASALFLRTMLAQPFVVGCEYFMWCDRPAQGAGKANAEDCNYGLVNEENTPYDDLLAALSPLLHDAPALRNAATMPPVKRQADSEPPSERDRYFADAAVFAAKNAKGRNDFVDSVSLVAENSGDFWVLSNAFVRVSGRIGSQFMADEIAICPVPETAICPAPETAVCPVPGTEVPGSLGRFTAMLQLLDCGTNTWIDVERVTDISFSRDPATGIASVTIRAISGNSASPNMTQGPSGLAVPPSGGAEGGAAFAITTRLSLAPDSRDLLAEILAVENLGEFPIEGWLPFLRTWSLESKPEPVRMVLDRWAAPCEAEWRLPGGGSWGIRSSDLSAKRFRFFVDKSGRQHPDARFAPVDALGHADRRPIAPGETWHPAVPMTARIYLKPAEGGAR